MFKIINWSIWIILLILWNYGFPQASPFPRCDCCRIFVDFVYNYEIASINVLEKVAQEVNSINNEGALNMGIHYDYKSTRGDKAMKKEAKKKHVLNKEEQRDQALIQKSWNRIQCTILINQLLLRI